MEDRAVNDSANNRILTVTQAGWLCDLMRGVEGKLNLRYYPFGTDSAVDEPRHTSYTLRAFTHDGGGFWFDKDGNIWDAYVWCSGIIEHWFKISDLIQALENAITAKYGEDKPMAIIER